MFSYNARDSPIPRAKQQRCCRLLDDAHGSSDLAFTSDSVELSSWGSKSFHFTKQLGVMPSFSPRFHIESVNLSCRLHPKHIWNRPVSLIAHNVWQCLPPFLTWIHINRVCSLSFCLPRIPWYIEKPGVMFLKHGSSNMTPSTLIKPSSGSLDLEDPMSASHFLSLLSFFRTHQPSWPSLETSNTPSFPGPCLLSLLYKRSCPAPMLTWLPVSYHWNLD